MSDSLVATAEALVGAGKGLLAMDESSHTCDERFTGAGIAPTVENRRAYREMIVTAPGLGDFVSGAILFDETLHQRDGQGTLLVERLLGAGIIPGIKVDLGAKTLALHPGEKVTEGLDGLPARVAAYRHQGARFAKWRGVIALAPGPSRACIRANAAVLARYAAICQDGGLVPIVEPEVLMTGTHGMARCEEVTGAVLHAVFEALSEQGVALEAMVLKPNMVLPGLSCAQQESVDSVAAATLRCLRRAVPAAVCGIAFLSGGQDGELASARLSAMNRQATSRHPAPWPLVFSFARAIQLPALTIWHGVPGNVDAAQRALLHRARCNHAALGGDYDATMEPAPLQRLAC